MSPEEFAVKLKQAEAQLVQLNRAYELWFRGAGDSEPLAQRKSFEASIQAMRQIRPPQRPLQLRFDNLVRRFHSFRNLWTRTVRKIEEGR